MYDGRIRASSERRRLRDAGRDDAVREVGFVAGVEQNVDAEEVAEVSGEVVVDREARLRVERLRRGRLSFHATATGSSAVILRLCDMHASRKDH